MSRLKSAKLNYLLSEWPAGVVLTSTWLKSNNYYKQLVKLYCDHGWIKSLGRGAYRRLNDEITWSGAVKALQSQLDIPVHVGGLTALQLYGISQYTRIDDHNPVFYLYNSVFKKITLPVWFQQYFTNCHVEQKKLFDHSEGLSKKMVNGVELNVAAPERAVLELLALVPIKITLSQAEELMEGLDRLRGQIMQQLLKTCHSIKVKRLFLYLAEKNNLACFNDLSIKDLELGSGKRVIGEGGSYSAKWMLSLPQSDELNEQQEEEDE